MDEQSRLRVFLVDDHAMFRAGVRAELGAYVDVVGEASTVGQAVTAIAALQPDVVLLDVHMPDGGGRAVLESVRKSHPQVKFLALSVSDAAEDVIGLIRAGARGYVTKTIAPDDLADAIRRVADDDAVFSPRLAGVVLDAFAARPDAPVAGPELDQLTNPEREVLRLLARGEPYKEIADDPGLQPLVAQQLGKGERVARVRIDGARGGLADGEVVRVARPGDALPALQRGAGEDAVRAISTDRPGDVPAQLDRRGEYTVLVPLEELHLLDPDGLGRRALLRLAQQGHLVARRLVEAARVAAGHDEVRDVEALVDPAGDGTGGAEVDVVRMRGHGEHPLDVGQRLDGSGERHSVSRVAPRGALSRRLPSSLRPPVQTAPRLATLTGAHVPRAGSGGRAGCRRRRARCGSGRGSPVRGRAPAGYRRMPPGSSPLPGRWPRAPARAG